jgi:hypothetical protein
MIWKKRQCRNFESDVRIFLTGLRKTTKNLSQDIGCPALNSKLEVLEYKAELLLLDSEDR